MASEKSEISEAELEIMKVLWAAGEAVGTKAIGQAVAHKGWKRTTVSTLLARLVEKGAVRCTKQGNTYFYAPLIPAREYRKRQTKGLIQRLYNGSIREFAVALFEDEVFSEEEIAQLKDLFDGREA